MEQQELPAVHTTSSTQKSTQEPHAVHGSFLQLCCALPPAEEQIGSSVSSHSQAKSQALPQGTWQKDDRGDMCAIIMRTATPSTS